MAAFEDKGFSDNFSAFSGSVQRDKAIRPERQAAEARRGQPNMFQQVDGDFVLARRYDARRHGIAPVGPVQRSPARANPGFWETTLPVAPVAAAEEHRVRDALAPEEVILPRQFCLSLRQQAHRETKEDVRGTKIRRHRICVEMLRGRIAHIDPFGVGPVPKIFGGGHANAPNPLAAARLRIKAADVSIILLSDGIPEHDILGVEVSVGNQALVGQAPPIDSVG